jgi:hypothetical protein
MIATLHRNVSVPGAFRHALSVVFALLMQIDKDGRLGVLRLSFDEGQAYDFRRE